VVWFAAQFLYDIVFVCLNLWIWGESYIVCLSALVKLVDYLLRLFVLLLFNYLCQKLIYFLTLLSFSFLLFNDGLFQGNHIFALENVVVDPNIQSINVVLNAVIEVFDKLFLIELIMGLKDLLALHRVDEVLSDFIQKLFVYVVFEDLAEL
jgi:hypothetical protein